MTQKRNVDMLSRLKLKNSLLMYEVAISISIEFTFWKEIVIIIEGDEIFVAGTIQMNKRCKNRMNAIYKCKCTNKIFSFNFFLFEKLLKKFRHSIACLIFKFLN